MTMRATDDPIILLANCRCATVRHRLNRDPWYLYGYKQHAASSWRFEHVAQARANAERARV